MLRKILNFLINLLISILAIGFGLYCMVLFGLWALEFIVNIGSTL